MTTIKDVARRAGVAISTVSAVLNHSAPTSADVVERVEAAIAELGYMPQTAARTLRSGQSKLIGVVVPDITNPHFSQVARVCENECLAAGFMTFVYNTDEDPELEMRILRMMRMQRVAGLVHISTRSDARHGARLLKEISAPAVLMGSTVARAPYDFVAVDDVAAGRMAASRLLELGHRRIAVLGGRPGVSSHDDRLKGCRAAFEAFGADWSAAQVAPTRFDQGLAEQHTRELMTARPTALLSFSNLMTIGALRALSELGLECPRDVAFVGIDDFEWADIMRPRPTLVAQPIAEMTRAAIRLLLEAIESGEPPGKRRVLFAPRLVVRESCGPVSAP